MANPSPTPITESDRARGALSAASRRRADALIRKLHDCPPLRREDLDRLIVAANDHPALTAESGVPA